MIPKIFENFENSLFGIFRVMSHLKSEKYL